MADIDYPEGLPLPLQDGYGIQHQPPTVNQTSITGRSVPRRRFRTVPSYVSVSWNMSIPEAQVFEAWFKADIEYGGIRDGTVWFNCPLQTPASGQVVQDYEARFQGIYDGPTLITYNRWGFTATLELRKRQTIDPAWVLYPQFVLGSSIIDKALNREWPKA